MNQVASFKDLMEMVKNCKVLDEDLSELSEIKPLPDIIIAFNEDENEFKELDIRMLKTIYGSELKSLLLTYVFLHRMIEKTKPRFINAETLKALISTCIVSLDGFPTSSYMIDLISDALIRRR